jgi:DNA-binding FadR family transcriptional regulator
MPPIDLDSDLLNYLAQQNLKPGERLPTIQDLQAPDHLGVSISKVREQLEVARALGLVEVRSKTGMRMKPYSFTPAVRLSLFYAMAQDPQNFDMFTGLRNHVETAYWHEACALLTPEDKALMRDCVEAARAKLNGHLIGIPNEEHRTFHLTVFRHLDNPFVLGLLEAYWDAYAAVEPNRYADYAYHQSVWNYHEQILEAICAGEIDRAQALFIEHTRLLRHEPRDAQQHTANEFIDKGVS